MAAIILARRGSPIRNSAAPVKVDEFDRADDLMPAYRNEPTLTDGPVNVSSASLMGTMPKAVKVLKQETFSKLTSSYEWKPMTIALTSAGLFFSRPGEDILRDFIPIAEIVDVK
jgi:hypothetical protein